MKERIPLVHDRLRETAHKAIDNAPLGHIVEINPPTRSNEQSARFHAAVRDVSRQVMWAGRYWSEETWKVMFVGSFFKQEVVQNLDGNGLLVVNAKTSRLTIGEMSDLTDFVYAFGNEHEVEWSE